MHLTIFLFFGGLFVLMWNESPWSVCIIPTIFCGIFGIYYIAATIRAPLLSFFGGIRQFDAQDFRGLRVQIWTPFTLGTHHAFNYIFVLIVGPIRHLISGIDSIKKSQESQSEQPTFSNNSLDPRDTPNANGSAEKSPQVPILYSDPEALSPESARASSPLFATDQHLPSEQTAKNNTTAKLPTLPPQPAHTVNDTSTGDMNERDSEFRRKLRAIRMRRVTEHEVIGAGRNRRRTIDV
ncbi:hypothetical protein RhiJN_06725 [Ceratobasidium sp. AG-Ba]|nr:hypothetical protein RhiJN_06725 [Ceratobasidium sp. AG-Ba]QRW07637.1 hypothetical protein RhiLY_06636 [Ceratobasidium sp. AG-Ba]